MTSRSSSKPLLIHAAVTQKRHVVKYKIQLTITVTWKKTYWGVEVQFQAFLIPCNTWE